MIRLWPEPMTHVTLYLVSESVPAISLQLARFGWFNPTASTTEADLKPQPDNEYRDIYQRARKRLDKIQSFIGVNFSDDAQSQTQMVDIDQLRAVDRQLGELWQHCSHCEERQRSLNEELRHISQLQNTLRQYRALNVNLSHLQQPHAFLDIRIGSVPLAEIDKLRDALSLNNCSLTVFERQKDLAHVVIAGLRADNDNIERVLNAASFRPTSLPPEFVDYPERLEQQLDAELQGALAEQRQLELQINEAARQQLAVLQQIHQQLAVASVYADVATQMSGQGALASIQGWVPANRIDRLKQILNESLQQRFVLCTRSPTVEEHASVPSYTEHVAFLKPFAALVRNYGVPRYGELDPTWLFALSYVLMFGMMFGDIGHGLVIMLAGVLLRHKLPGYWMFPIAIGASSTLFGFVYGSLFGFEEVIHAWWMSPMEDPVLMLTIALGWGVGFILLMIVLNIRNRWQEGRYHEALLSGQGFAGLVLYVGLLALGWQWFVNGRIVPASWLLVLLPLLTMFIHGWRQLTASRAERVLVVFIELFETIMSYFSNTLSFLRVAAFSLNHVALFAAVFMVANAFDTTGAWISIVLGNLFVLVLEGAIVAIQVLRLEYYEGFSRFYRGDGVAFRPLRLGGMA